MSYLERLDARAAINAVGEPLKGSKGGFEPFAGDPRALIPELPAACIAGLRRLKGMPSPRLARPDLWPVAVADALRLAADGWAATALAMGWKQLDLFGAVPDRSGDLDADGLAVRLGNRRLLALCASFATVDLGNGGRIYLHRGNNDGAILLWDLGRGR
jgi:hypothetical protein